MGVIGSYRDLIVWPKAMDLVVAVNRLSECILKIEMYRRIDQTSRAAASVPGNIAEAHARAFTKENLYHLSVAKGSLMETETFLMLAVRLGYVSEPKASPALTLIIEVSKMTTAIRAKLS